MAFNCSLPSFPGQLILNKGPGERCMWMSLDILWVNILFKYGEQKWAMQRKGGDIRDIPRCLWKEDIALLVPGPDLYLVKNDSLYNLWFNVSFLLSGYYDPLFQRLNLEWDNYTECEHSVRRLCTDFQGKKRGEGYMQEISGWGQIPFELSCHLPNLSLCWSRQIDLTQKP